MHRSIDPRSGSATFRGSFQLVHCGSIRHDNLVGYPAGIFMAFFYAVGPGVGEGQKRWRNVVFAMSHIIEGSG